MSLMQSGLRLVIQVRRCFTFTHAGGMMWRRKKISVEFSFVEVEPDTRLETMCSVIITLVSWKQQKTWKISAVVSDVVLSESESKLPLAQCENSRLLPAVFVHERTRTLRYLYLQINLRVDGLGFLHSHTQPTWLESGEVTNSVNSKATPHCHTSSSVPHSGNHTFRNSSPCL